MADLEAASGRAMAGLHAAELTGGPADSFRLATTAPKHWRAASGLKIDVRRLIRELAVGPVLIHRRQPISGEDPVSVCTRPKAQMRLIESDVDRYLLPTERSVITVRKHPSMLLRSLSFLVCALATAVVLTVLIVANDSPRAISHGIALSVIWVAWGLILLRFLKRVAEWSVDFITLTNQRLISMSGPFVRKVSIMPLSELTDLSFRRSTWGRLFGYGTIIGEREGQQKALLSIDYVPDPEKFYREVVFVVFNSNESEL